jgi:hypothetical protein
MWKLFWLPPGVEVFLEDTFLRQQDVHESAVLVEQPMKFGTDYIEMIKILT